MEEKLFLKIKNNFQKLKMSLESYIKWYENSISHEECDELIKLFENNASLHERKDIFKRPSFTQLNLTKNFEHTNIYKILSEKVFFYTSLYAKDTNSKFFPPVKKIESFRIKKYNNDGVDEFKEHTDNSDSFFCRRYLAIFWYLNDVEKGGETIFTNLNISIKCRKARILMFPPMWMYPHAGLPPISNPKYLVGTYCVF